MIGAPPANGYPPGRMRSRPALRIVSTSSPMQAAWTCALGGALTASSAVVVPASSPAIASALQTLAQFLGAPCETTAWDGVHGMVEGLFGCDLGDMRESDALAAYRQVCARVASHETIDVCTAGPRAAARALAGKRAALAWSRDGLVAAMRSALLGDRRVLYDANATSDPAGFRALADSRSILACPPSTFTADALSGLREQKRAADNGVPIGLLYPFGDETGELFALKSHVYAALPGDEELPYTFSYPLERRRDIRAIGRSRFLIGANVDRAATLALLSAPAQLFFSTPHSNGVNLSLGPVVLCSREDHDERQAPDRAPPCFHADICNRERSSANRMASTQIPAAVAFLNTCWGVVLRGGAYDVEISLGHRLIGSAYVCALISAHSTSVLDRAAGPYLAELYSRGVPLGEAVARLNRRHHERFGDVLDAMLLFGDPDARLPGRAPLDLCAHPEFQGLARSISLLPYPVDDDRPASTELALPCEVPAEQFGSIEYARCVASGMTASAMDVMQAPTDELAAASSQLWSANALFNSRLLHASRASFRAAELTRHRQQALARYHAAWLDFYTALVCNFGGYVRFQVDRYFQEIGRSERAGRCPYCDATVMRSRQRLIGASAVLRERLDCPNCATIFERVGAITSGCVRGEKGLYCRFRGLMVSGSDG